MPVAVVDRQRIYLEDSGGDGPPVVFSHGHLADHTAFGAQVADLADVYRVITWDARGTGLTASDGEPFTSWDLARDVFGLLDVLGIERAVLAGTEQGAELSLRAALLHPDRVRALVLVDPLAPASTGGEQPADTDDITDRLAEIASPVLLVHGADGPDLPSSRARDVRAGVSDCRGIIEVAGAGRTPHRTHPQVVTTAIRDFLEGLPA